ncbi:MAG: glycosyltransferase family 1 protein [Nitrospirota bacterium]
MKIGLDLINLYDLHVGLGRYAQQLIDGLATLDRENEYILFINNINKKISNQIYVNNPRFHVQVVKTPSRKYAPWNQIYFAFHRKKLQNLDLLHSPVTPLPLLLSKKVKTVITLHDLSWKIFPEHFRPEGVAWWRFVWPRSLKRSTHIVVDSENTKQSVLKFYYLPEEKITVIYPYILLHLLETSPENLNVLKKRYNLPPKYILYVGALRKNKNLESLLKAFQILKKEKSIFQKLVLAGPKDWGNEKIFLEIKRLNLEDEVIVTGAISNEDLPLIYKRADVFVFPSLHEGFGYPPLEATACGTPVVVSNTSSLPEVVGEAGLYFDPLNPKDIAEKIYQVLSSPALAEKLRNLGLKRAQEFSMEKMIQKYLEVYKKVSLCL